MRGGNLVGPAGLIVNKDPIPSFVGTSPEAGEAFSVYVFFPPLARG